MNRLDAEVKFEKQLFEAINEGYGIVPLIGSGFSAPAGIPIGGGFGDYILNFIRKILDKTETEIWWDPSNPNWPELDDPDASVIFKNGKKELVKTWIKEWKKTNSGVLLEAVGAISDWRSALTLLSRLPIIDPEHPEHQDAIVLRSPDVSVVDSAFIHVTQSRQPTLGQMMLAHCSDAFRIQTVLTTNFDTLIEDAFAQQGIYLTTFDVHQRAGLPAAPLVLAQRSVVKLHGGRYGLRADYTLDEDPTSHDCETFRSYFSSSHSLNEHRKHLLVIGLSGNDARMISLIRHALKKNKKMKVFWVYHNEPKKSDVTKQLKKLGITRDRFLYTRKNDIGLYLLALYQKNFVSLPPAGANYPSRFSYPPNAYSKRKSGRGAYKVGIFDSAVTDLKKKIRKIGKPILVVKGEAGLSSVASEVYCKLSSSHHTIWLELDQYVDVDDFLLALVNAVSRKLGKSMTTPAIGKWSSKEYRRFLGKLLQGSGRQFIVFVNGREGPGTGTLWERCQKSACQAQNPDGWDQEKVKLFWEQLSSINQDISADKLKIIVIAGNNGLAAPNWLQGVNEVQDVLTQKCLTFAAKSVKKNLRNKYGKWDTEQLRFVYALTLFRQSRFPAALMSWGLIKAIEKLASGRDNDEHRLEMSKEYISELEEIRAVRLQPGGMVWMHADIRQAIKSELEKRNDELSSEQASIHQGIADWYVKLFRSSNDPRAALESIYHRIQSVEQATTKLKDSPYEDLIHELDISNILDAKELKKSGILEARELEITGILEAAETLKLSRDRILVDARSTAASYVLEQVVSRISDSSVAPVYHRHKEYLKQLKIVCEDLLCDFTRTRGGEFQERRYRHPRLNDQVATGLETAIQLRQDADGLLHQRRYSECEAKLKLFFETIELQCFQQNLAPDVFKMREIARNWCLTNEDGMGLRTQAKMKLAVKGVRTFLFLQMLISQAYGFQSENKNKSVEHILRLQYAESLYTHVTSITRFVTDHDFLQVENTYIRTHYGVILAELGRFHEAHRRLNEATGYLSQSSKRTDGLAWAIIDLRRAETYLYQARDASETLSIEAILGDMRFAIDRAKQRFVNQRKDVWWWTLLLELELTYVLERVRLRSRETSTVLSRREVKLCNDVVEESLLIVHANRLRLARIAEILHQILQRIESNKTVIEQIIELRKRVMRQLESMNQMKVPSADDYENKLNTYYENKLNAYVESVLILGTCP